MHLQRLTINFHHLPQTALKNQSLVHFPVSGLNVSPYTLKGKLNLESASPALYDLTAFCVHTGAHSTAHGHYIAYCKTQSDRWYCFNDDYVHAVDGIGSELKKTFVLQNAYILFYSLRN